MRSTFNFVGKVYPKKQTENFSPWVERKSERSDWKMKRLIFSMVSNYSNLDVTVNAGCYPDGHNKVYFQRKGKNNTSETDSVLFSERKNVNLDNVQAFSKYTINLNEYSKYELEKCVNGKSELLTKEEAEKLLKNYDKGVKSYISSWDFVDMVKKIVENDKFKGKKFHATGDVVFEVNSENGKVYTKYEMRSFSLMRDEAEDKNEANIMFYFTSDAFEDTMEEAGKIEVSGWTPKWNSERKANDYIPYSFVVDRITKETEEDTERANRIRKKRFTCEEENIVKEALVKIAVINGTELVEIKMEDLSEEEQDAIFCGEITLEELQKEYRREMAGDRVIKNAFISLGRGYTKGTVVSDVTMDDIEGVDNSDENVDSIFEDENDETDNVFTDDDDDLDDLFGGK